MRATPPSAAKSLALTREQAHAPVRCRRTARERSPAAVARGVLRFLT